MKFSQPEQLGLITAPCEGEVLFVQEPNEEKIDLYIVRIVLPNGQETVAKNVSVATMFGDPINTSRVRLRPMFVKGEKEEYIFKNEETIGERVIVSFLGGDINRPVITGRLPHTSSESPFYAGKSQEESKGEPQVFFSFQGFDFTIDDKGSLEITHNGAPKRLNRKISKNTDESVVTKITIVEDGSVDIVDSKKQNIHIDTTREFMRVGTEKADINISLKDSDITIQSEKTINVETETCNVKANKMLDIRSPHVIMNSEGVTAEFKGARYEISGPTFKLLEDTSLLLDLLIKNQSTTCFHPAIGFIQNSANTNVLLTKQKLKIDATKLK